MTIPRPSAVPLATAGPESGTQRSEPIPATDEPGWAPDDREAPVAPTFGARARRHRSVRAGVVLFVVVALLIVVGPAIYGVSPSAIEPASRFEAPSLDHPFGTDELGRDQLARTLDGGRQSLVAALVVLAGTFSLALVVGVAAGALGGLVDTVVMRLVDVLLAIPNVVLTLAILGTLGPGFRNLLIAIVASSWAGSARIARSFVLAGRTRPDMVAARMAGVSWARATSGHLLPPAATQLLVVATLDLGHVIIIIAGLSFLGVGAEAGAAEWGAMLAAARPHLVYAPWLIAGPCVGIVLAVLAANLVGDGLHDALESAES